MMKRIIILSLMMLYASAPAHASQLNLEPYFGFGTSYLSADLAGDKASSPGFQFIAGSRLNWISEDLAAELRLGFGGQYTTFNGDLRLYTSYLLKPSFEITRQLDMYVLAGYSTTSVSIAGQNGADASPSFGLGLNYRIPNESLSVSGEWLSLYQSSDSSTTSISGMDISGVSISFVFEYY